MLLGVGNPLRGDDGFGPALIQRLKDFPVNALDAGTAPENFIGPAARVGPGNVLVADAADLREPSGTLALLERDEILRVGGLTTHNLSPALFMEQLEERCGAPVRMLAVQPRTTAFGAPLSREVEEALDLLVELIRAVTAEEA